MVCTQAVEERREGAAAQRRGFQRAQGATHLMAPVAARKLRQELAKVSFPLEFARVAAPDL